MTTFEQDQAPADIVQEVDDQVAPVPPLPVTVTDPARVVLVPSFSAGMRTFSVTTTVAQKILDRDPRRKRALITVVATDSTNTVGVILAPTQSSTGGPTSFLLPMPGPNIALGRQCAGPIEVTSMDEVWALGSGGTVTVSVLAERWAN